MFGYQCYESFGSVFVDISVFQIIGDEVKLFIFQQFVNYNM